MIRPGFYEHRTPAMGLKPYDDVTDPEGDFGIPFETVTFPATDGQTLRGWFVPGTHASSALVTAHGGGGDRRSFHSMIPALHAAGFPILLFDSREQGISDGKGDGISIGYREHEDVISAVDYLTDQRGFSQIGVFGSSQGAISAILAAAIDARIHAIVAQSAATSLTDLVHANPLLNALPRGVVQVFVTHFYLRQGASWEVAFQRGKSPLDVIENISPRAVFLIHGDQDLTIPVEQAHRNYAAAREPKTLWIIKGGKHRGLRQYVKEEYANRTIAFLDAHLSAGHLSAGHLNTSYKP